MSVTCERRGRVAWVRVAEPRTRNAMSARMWHELAAHVGTVASDPAVRALVIGGREEAFVSGADLGDFRDFARAADGIAYEGVVETALRAVEALDVPTFAAISGACTGGGAILACACDVRLGATNARVGLPIAKTVGNVTTAANLTRLVAIVGRAPVLRWLVTAELSDARDAERVGFFGEVIDGFAALEARADALAAAAAGYAPLTIAAGKELVRRTRARDDVDDRDLLARCYGSDDFREGVRAFGEKRAPRFVGR